MNEYFLIQRVVKEREKRGKIIFREYFDFFAFFISAFRVNKKLLLLCLI